MSYLPHGSRRYSWDFSFRQTIGLINRIAYQEETGCWNWTGGTQWDGRGVSQLMGKTYTAPRISAWLWLGWRPESGLWVLHKCDNPRCFNPKHLYLGTAKDNARDALVRGRNALSKRTHCNNGHEFTADSVVDWKGRRGRVCKVCVLKVSMSRSKTHRPKKIPLAFSKIQ